MFLGRYCHSFDNKGRLTIPVRFRDLLSNGAYIIQGFDHSLMVFPPHSFEKISQKLNHLSMTDPSVRQLKRKFFANAERVEMDRAGRILIPQFLRQIASLDDEAVLVGAGEYFEIWAPNTWTEQDSLLQNEEANTQQFMAYSLTAD